MWRALIILPITRHEKKGDQCWLSDVMSPNNNRITWFVQKAFLGKLPEIGY